MAQAQIRPQDRRIWCGDNAKPKASDHKGSGPVGSKSQKHMEDREYLCATVATEQSGALNPDWVEWLMGYPIGHTELKPLETP